MTLSELFEDRIHVCIQAAEPGSEQAEPACQRKLSVGAAYRATHRSTAVLFPHLPALLPRRNEDTLIWPINGSPGMTSSPSTDVMDPMPVPGPELACRRCEILAAMGREAVQ